MFTGICFLLACGVFRDQLIFRVGPQAYSEALTVSHVA